jgi:hypothetical protein
MIQTRHLCQVASDVVMRSLFTSFFLTVLTPRHRSPLDSASALPILSPPLPTTSKAESGSSGGETYNGVGLPQFAVAAEHQAIDGLPRAVAKELLATTNVNDSPLLKVLPLSFSWLLYSRCSTISTWLKGPGGCPQKSLTSLSF